MSSRSIGGACDCSDLFDVGHVDGCDVAASCGSDGECAPVPAFDTGREGMVWLSRVKRREVMITCGT
jgi:hypothetical protein